MLAPRVLLYGSSLFLLSIEANLQENPRLELVRVKATTADLLAQLRNPDPAVIVFDRGATPAEALLPLLIKQPALVLIGLDPASTQAVVLSGRSSAVTSARDLSLLVHAHLPQEQ